MDIPVLAVNNRGAVSAGGGDAAPVPGGNALESAEIGSFLHALVALAAPPAGTAEAVETPGEPAAVAPAAFAVQVAPGADLPPPRQALPDPGPALPPMRQVPLSSLAAWSGTATRRVLGELSGVAPTVETAAVAVDFDLPLDAASRSAAEPSLLGKPVLPTVAVGPAAGGDIDVAALLTAAGVATGGEASGTASQPTAAVVGGLHRAGEAVTSTPAQAYGETAGGLPVRDAGLFAERLNQHVAVMLSQHVQHARLAVNPPELGPVEVRVTVTGDEANVQLVATHATTREALEEALPRLRAAFQDGGITLGQAAVYSETPAHQGAPRQGGDGRPTTAAHELASAEDPSSPVARRVPLGLVDAFV